MSKIDKRKNNRTRHEFLLTLFPNNPQPFYLEMKKNGFYLVRHYSGTTKSWEVAIYSKQSFLRYKAYSQKVTADKVSDNQQTIIFKGGRKSQANVPLDLKASPKIKTVLSPYL
jgi:hypothetical protein